MANSTREERKGMEHMDKAKDSGHEALNKAKDAGKEAMGAAKEAGNDAMNRAKDMGTDVMGKAKEVVGAVGDMASQAVGNVGHKADDLVGGAGHSIRQFGDDLAKKAPHEGMAGAASQAVAQGIKTGGRYLEEARMSGMAQDVEEAVRTHPVPAMLICLGIGFCLGRLIRD